MIKTLNSPFDTESNLFIISNTEPQNHAYVKRMPFMNSPGVSDFTVIHKKRKKNVLNSYIVHTIFAVARRLICQLSESTICTHTKKLKYNYLNMTNNSRFYGYFLHHKQSSKYS